MGGKRPLLQTGNSREGRGGLGSSGTDTSSGWRSEGWGPSGKRVIERENQRCGLEGRFKYVNLLQISNYYTIDVLMLVI